MSSRRFVAAAAQMQSAADPVANLDTVRELATRAGERGATLFCLPECFAFIGESERAKFSIAEVLDPTAPGPILETLVDIAQRHGFWVSAGGLPERLESEASAVSQAVTSAYNSHLIIDPKGAVRARYRKIHLFDVDIPGKATLRESDSTTAGQSPVSIETGCGVLGLTICYDLRFPELFRTLAVGHGADVLLVPAAFTAHTGAAHWHTLLRARAIENQCWVIAAAQGGRHNSRRESYGHSLIIDPWGRVVAETTDANEIAFAEVDLDRIAEIRERMPCHRHRTLSFS